MIGTIKLERLFDLALVAGRFQPIHSGHEKLIDTALGVAERVIVLLGSSNEYGTVRNPLSSVTRANLIRHIYPDERRVIIGNLNDRPDVPGVCEEWGLHVLATSKQYARKLPEVFVYGRELDNGNWFDCSDKLRYLTRSMTQVVISREHLNINATAIRRMLINDDYESFFANTNPRIHQYYDELRAELLNARDIYTEMHPN